MLVGMTGTAVKSEGGTAGELRFCLLSAEGEFSGGGRVGRVCFGCATGLGCGVEAKRGGYAPPAFGVELKRRLNMKAEGLKVSFEYCVQWERTQIWTRRGRLVFGFFSVSSVCSSHACTT